MAGSRGGPAETGHGRLVEAHAAGVEARGLSQAAKTPPISPLRVPLPWPQGSRQPEGPPSDVSGVAPGTPWRAHPGGLSCFSERWAAAYWLAGQRDWVLGPVARGMTLASMETSRRRQHARNSHPAKKSPFCPA